MGIDQIGQTGCNLEQSVQTTDGPTSFPSASLGFATNCGDYDSSSDNSLISPSYYVPLGQVPDLFGNTGCVPKTVGIGALYVSLTVEHGIKPTSIMLMVGTGMTARSLTQLVYRNRCLGWTSICSCISGWSLRHRKHSWLDMDMMFQISRVTMSL